MRDAYVKKSCRFGIDCSSRTLPEPEMKPGARCVRHGGFLLAHLTTGVVMQDRVRSRVF